MVNEIVDMVLYGWDGAAALFGILTVALAAALVVCAVCAVVIGIKIIVCDIQIAILNNQINKLSSGKGVE